MGKWTLRFRRLGRALVTRGYALALMLVVGYAGCAAFSYLLGILLHPGRTPQRIRDWEMKTDLASQRDGRTIEEGRSPMSHFHQVGRRPGFNAANGCTTAGCHAPLPHGPKMKAPTFANFHVAFISCQTCHTEAKQRPVPTVWMDPKTGRPSDAPAVLRLMSLLKEQSEPAAIQPKVLAWGRQIVALRGSDPVLQDLLLGIETSEPGSPVWTKGIKHLEAELPRYARGNYGAKITPRAVQEEYAVSNQKLRGQAGQALAAPEGSAGRKAVNDQIHASVVRKPAGCLMCHSDSPGLIDFAALGYPAGRARALRSLELARLMEQIRQGGQFHLPTLTGAADAK